MEKNQTVLGYDTVVGSKGSNPEPINEMAVKITTKNNYGVKIQEEMCV